ncbi:hypothetical protein [Thermomonas aquatica]|uniref:Uncharacterized protein n=1 Tax=Thermomonas aquatica TaxID=2202149 RepID=A0A5B7ZPJ7_9GAMM|nr:hypothetical protein [Thermomonas aquatica]QDA56473.1 hypothetical protein FHQ07_03675 [Thermomonas aquatica]
MTATPDWFGRAEEATPVVMSRIANVVMNTAMAPQVNFLPRMAHWFLLDSLLLANQANREGMHANALSLTRQCIESISVIELGLCGHAQAEAMLHKWESDDLSPGKLRAWLEANVWSSYGSGLWHEPWPQFMRQFAAALQPYAHYSAPLSQWQVKLLDGPANDPTETGSIIKLIQVGPRAYDAQKATRITLFHAIVTYVLGRILLAAGADEELSVTVNRLGKSLSESKYLDGHQTDWSQQFWAMVWRQDGRTILE